MASAHKLELGEPRKVRGVNWLERYRLLIHSALGIEIRDHMKDFNLFEELILARNRAQHAVDIGTTTIYQDVDYARRYPRGHFIDNFYAGVVREGHTSDEPAPIPLEVNAESVSKAIAAVREFCASIERAFQQHPPYLRAMLPPPPNELPP